MLEKAYTYALYEGQPVNMPCDGYIFPKDVKNLMDFKGLYYVVRKNMPKDCTYLGLIIGDLTPCVLAIVRYCICKKITLTCWHYDTESGKYKAQGVVF